MIHRLTKNARLRNVILLVVAIVLSITVVSPFFCSTRVQAPTLDVIKESKEQATALSLTVTLASTAISMLPEDTGAPIADELSELSTPLLIVVCILYFEQFMLTSLEFLAFSVLIPTSLLVYIAYLYNHKKSVSILATKLLLIGILCACMIPASAGITHLIRQTFKASIDAVQVQIDEIGVTFSKMLGDGSEGDILKFISGLASGIGSALDFAKSALGLLIDAIAILLITSCVIPIVTALLFVWGIKRIAVGQMENIHDTAMDILKHIPIKKDKHLPPDDTGNDNMFIAAS